MRYLLKKISVYIAFTAMVFYLLPVQMQAQIISTQANNLQSQTDNLEPPEVILNDQKIIFNKKPILDSEGWLFPLEEIAVKLQDKISTDLVNGIITIQRNRDKSIVQLNVKNGVVTVNNRPFRTLLGFNRILLGADAQMVPTSALVILLRLTSEDKEDGKLVLKNTVFDDITISRTIQPKARTGLKDLLVDYLTVTNGFNWYKTQNFISRRTEINSGFHNDKYALTSDLVLTAGTGAPLVNLYGGNFSFYKNNSPFQIHVGDRPLSLIKSPLLGGITMRGIQIQTDGKLKDSRFVFSSGLLPTNSKVIGRNLPFVRYGRLAEIAEWSSSPNKPWQYSIGQAIYTDLIANQLIRTEQRGGLFALSAAKSGKYIEGVSNLALSTAKDELSGKAESGPGADLLVRLKPKDWFSIFTKGAYYAPGFYALSGNPYYTSRNEATCGINITPPRSNLSISESVGQYNLNAKRPNDYKITNLSFSTTPVKNGPTLITTYSKNDSKISATRAIDNILFPINNSNLSTVDLETLIERRTNSFFRTSLIKSWRTVNFTSSFNYFTFSQDNPLRAPILGSKAVNTFWTYDFNINKYLNRYTGLQTYFQGSELYKQVRFGLNLGPVLNNKLSFQVQTGALLHPDSNPTGIYSLNLNYQVNKKNQFSLSLDKTAYQTNLSTLWQYNLRPTRGGSLSRIGEEQSIGRIHGRVLVLEEPKKQQPDPNKILLPGLSRERGIANIRIHLGNYTIATDETGRFEFPSLTPGIHTLRVEYSDLPSYLTSITPETVDVKVEPAKETNYSFVLAYFGSVNGKLLLANEPPLTLEEEPELQDIRVYLEGTEFETLTNLDGSFELGDVKPGKYKLKVDPDFLPEALAITEQEIEIKVDAKGKVENIQLPIKYKEKEKQIKEFN